MNSSEGNNVIHLLKSLIPCTLSPPPAIFVLLLIFGEKAALRAAPAPPSGRNKLSQHLKEENPILKSKIFTKKKKKKKKRNSACTNMGCKYYTFDNAGRGNLSVAHTREEASLPPGGTEELKRKTP